jgi:CHAT domain-containing protein
VSPLAIGWVGGPRTQIELAYEDSQIKVRYAPGYRTTVRIPVQPQAFDFAQIDVMLAALGANGVNRRADMPDPALAAADPDLQTLGSLLASVLPGSLITELQRPEMYLELGIAENLLKYPWELMHDEQRFLCRRHNVARYINATSFDFAPTKIPSWWDAKLDKIRVLVISVPSPEPRNGQVFGHLDAVESEARAVSAAVTKIPHCSVRWLKNPSFVDLHRELSNNRYHIVHYCGHAEFGGERQGRLILPKEDMPAQVWKTLMQKTEAVVCLLNGCETARQDGAFSGGRYGLARAVLDTGAYLIGTAWNVNDEAAEAFANTFYGRFLTDLSSIGAALRSARDAAFAAVAEIPAWASYVLYGDPRLRLEVVAE